MKDGRPDGAREPPPGRIVVHKYGGTSVGDADRIRAVAGRIERGLRAGDRIAAVVSAMAGETDRLLSLAGIMQDPPDARELDALLATGEQAAAALLSLALRGRGLAAECLTGWQAGLETDGAHGRARIIWFDADRVREVLDRGAIPVLAGFQGMNAAEDITTLGRGGSDTTAVALAVALRAHECIICKDVDGILTADPRIVPVARHLKRITFEEMMELAGLGSKVLQARSVALAGRHRLPLRVVSTFQGGEGTLISYEETQVEAPRIAGITSSADEALVTLAGIPAGADVVWRALEGLAGAGVEVDMLSQQTIDGKSGLSFTVQGSDYERALAELRTVNRDLGAREVSGERGLAKISVVGVGIRRAHARAAARFRRTLASEGITVRLMASSEIKISVAIHADAVERAVRALHHEFGLDKVEETEAVE